MEKLIDIITQIPADDWVTIILIFMGLLSILFKRLGWDKGVIVLDQIEAGLQQAKPYIMKARLGDENTIVNINKATKQAAAHIQGVNADDMNDLVRTLLTSETFSAKGISVTLDRDGNLSVDPSGAISKYGSKAGKWLKKVF